MRYLLPVLVGLFAPLALAEVVEVTWVNATQNTDSTPIPTTGDGSLTGTMVEYGTCQSRNPDVFGVAQGEMWVAAPATGMEVSLVVVQEWCLRAKHRNTYGEESDWSNVVVKMTAPPTPMPPTNLAVTLSDLTVYTIVQTLDRVALVAVGTALPGTQCDGSQSVLGKYVVPRSAVAFAGPVQPQVVFATCG